MPPNSSGDTVDQRLREAALQEARRNSQSLVAARKWLFPIQVATTVSGAALGAILDQLVFGNAAREEVWIAVASSLGILTVALLVVSRRLDNRLRDAAVIAPTDLLLYVDGLKEEAATYRALNRSHQAWTFLQRETANDVRQFITGMNKRLTTTASAPDQADKVAAELEMRFGAVVDRVVGQLEDKRRELLGYDGLDEIYFFDVFELNPQDGKLYVLKGRTNAPQRYFRSWGPGDGHLGYCLQNQQDHFVNYEQTVNAFSGEHQKPTDKDYFACRITALIRAADGRSHGVHGAICITSSQNGRLSEEQLALVSNLAQPLIGLFYARELVKRRIHGPS